MDDVKQGDVVRGFGTRKKAPCLLYVDKLNYYPYGDGIASVSGRIVDPSGKITLKEDTILKSSRMREAKIDISNPEEPIFDKISSTQPVFPGGWEIIRDFQILGPTATLASRVRGLGVGDMIDVAKTENTLASCRVTVSLLKDTTGHSYVVNKTPTGCKITRTA